MGSTARAGQDESDGHERRARATRQPHTRAARQDQCVATASNTALPSRKHEGLVGPLRPWSGSRSCGGPPRPLSLPFARASRADARTKTGVCARAVRAHPCPWILQATTMRRTAGIENKIRTRVERREKPPNSLPPYPYSFLFVVSHPSRPRAVYMPKSQPRTGHTRRTETRRTQKPNRTLGRSQDAALTETHIGHHGNTHAHARRGRPGPTHVSTWDIKSQSHNGRETKAKATTAPTFLDVQRCPTLVL